ncbi:MAG TPA: hypothetical protein VFU63_14255 [Ktedonobacterales bacterium]|nr:hypothetical protein [Ktedonobacterales bacterium]
MRTDAQTTRIGQLDVSFRTGTVFAARAALQNVIDAHLFARECEATFTFTYHFASIEAWLRHMGAHWSSARTPAGLVELASEMLSSGVSELCIPREIHAGRLRRL